jgi:hypothetical protein
MVTAPEDIPLTTPVSKLTEAIAGSELLHAPPDTALESVVVAPAQTDVAPEMAVGTELPTNTGMLTLQ